jgi:nucleotide-binding universal stress UspA family protein
MPGTRRIFAGVSGSPGSVHALRQAAQLAHHHDALLIPVLAWLPPDSRRLPWPELRQIWHDDAWQRLRDTLDATFGGLPDGIATEPAVLRGNPPQGADRCGPQDGDVLVIGAGRRGRLRRMWGSRASRYCPAHAHCPVLAILPPWPGRQATACAAGRSGTARPGQQPSPPREPATLPTGPSRAAGERTHRLSRARRGDWPSQQGGKWS